MKTIIDEDGCLRLYITKEEYVFVLNELTKLNNYMLSMPEYYEDTNTTLLSQPIEANICDRYGRIYDAIFAFLHSPEKRNGSSGSTARRSASVERCKMAVTRD